MLSRRTIVLIICLSILPFLTFSQWSWQNPLPQGHYLTTIKGIDKLHGCAGGVNGTIMSTRNGGANWILFHDNARRSVRSVDFSDSLNGWAVGQYGLRYHTIDGGQSWIDRSTDSTGWYSSVTFPDALHGWICNESGSDNGPWKIMRTADGGNTWTQCPTPQFVYVTMVKFIDSVHGWLVDDNYGNFYATSDGGNTWAGKYAGASVLDFYFTDPMHGCVALDTHVIYTADGGTTWITSATANMYISAVTMTSPDVIYCTGMHYDYPANPYSHARIGKSTNRGATWSYSDFPEPPYLAAISCGTDVMTDYPVIWSAGEGGALFRSQDEGGSWQSLVNSKSFADMGSIFFDKTFPVGWVATHNGYLMKTSDGGNNWHKMMTGINSPLNAVWFLDTLSGFAAGDQGVLLRTTNGGASWTFPLPVYAGHDYIGLCFSDPLNGWTITGNGHVFHTGDGGNNWNAIGSTGIETFGFTFPDDTHGWAVGQWGAIRETHDGGKHWNSQESHVEITQIWDVSFTDSLYGWCAVGRGYKIHTTDGGKNWLVDGSIYQDAWDHYAVKFLDHNTGYMTGEYYWDYDGFVLKTTDGGATWNEMPMTIGNTANHIFANDTSAVYGTGRNGTIFKYTGGLLQPIEDKQGRVQASCRPNPFAEGTMLSLNLPASQSVSVQVFNVKGRLVLQLDEKSYPAGNVEIPVSLEGYPAGVYLYQMKAGKSGFYGKMVKCSASP